MGGDSCEYFLSLAEEGLEGGCSMVEANFFFGPELFMTVLMENREAREAAAEKSGASSSSERKIKKGLGIIWMLYNSRLPSDRKI